MYKSSFNVDQTPSTTSHRIMGFSAKRRVITFFSVPSESYSVSPEPGVTNTTGFLVAAGQSPIIIHHELHGDLTQREWYARSSVGDRGPIWIESLECHCDNDGRRIY